MTSHGRKRREREPLTRDRIFTAALTLVDRDGADALTMRRLAAELHVEAMSLYHHIRDREDLLDGLAEVMVSSGLPGGPFAGAWPDLLLAFASGIRDTAHRHSAAFRLVGLRPLRSPEATLAVTRLLTTLAAHDLSPADAVLAYRTVTAYARGFALSEIEGLTFGADSDVPVPHELEPFAAYLRRPTDDVFAAGVRAVVSGIQTHSAL